MSEAPERPRQVPLFLLALLFLLTGMSALMLQVVWQRRLAILFGNTVQATSAVLAAFLGSLAIGSWWLGRRADRVSNPLRWFGVLELWVGAGAAFSLLCADRFGELGALAFDWFGGETASLAVARCLIAFLMIAPAVVPMGGTLPAVAASAIRLRRPGSTVGLLYGLNTLGAAGGGLLAAFVTVEALGIRGTWSLAVVIDLVVAVAVLAAARWRPGVGIERSAMPPSSAGAAWPQRNQVLALVFTSGAALLALEVLWTRALILHLGSHIGSFALVLAMVLAGLGVGALVGGWLADRAKDAIAVAAFCAVLAALAGMWGVAGLRDLSSLMGELVIVLRPSGYWGSLLVQAVAVARVVLLPSVVGGLILPILMRATLERLAIGSRIGVLGAVSTVGTLVGSLAAGFLLVPWFGVGQSFVMVLLFQLGVGGVVLVQRSPRRGIIAGLLVGAGFLGLWREAAPVRTLLLAAGIFSDPDTKVVFSEDGLHGLVTVEERRDGELTYRSLSVNGINVAGTALDLVAVQKMQGHVPLLLHGPARRVLHIGIGSGGTAYSVSTHDVERIDVVELNPRVPVAADRYMRDMNHGILYTDPRVQIHYGDGRTFLAATRDTYDVILSDSIHPRFAGNGALYTRDYYELCRQRLTEGGVVSQWLPLYSLPPDLYRSIVRAFLDVFPDSTMWYLNDTLNPHSILVGSRGGFHFGAGTMSAAFARAGVAADLAEIGIRSPQGFLANFMVGRDGLQRLTEGVSPHSDDFPLVEYTAGRRNGEHYANYYAWTWWQNFASLLAVREPWPGMDDSALSVRLQGYESQLEEHSR